VTHKAGLDVELFGMGVAVGDYDNDGFDDLFVTAYGQSHLFHNNGNGTFADVTQKAGLLGPKEFSSSAAWVDYDKDGRLDLIVGNYVQWAPETDLYCTLDGKSKSYCTPESYKGTSVRLWHNRGDGTFEDVTQKAGLAEPTSKTLGIAVLDYDNDGWPDLLFSNDTQPNKLYRNNGNGTFTEKAVVAGVAFSEDGVARAGMGVDASDYDHSGFPSLLITNFSNQMISLYHNEGKGLFVDEAPRSDIGRASLLTLGFGCFFFDYDLDGWPDVLVANGHIDADIQRVQSNVKYAMPPHLFRNTGKGKFEEVTKSLGQAFASARVGRVPPTLTSIMTAAWIYSSPQMAARCICSGTMHKALQRQTRACASSWLARNPTATAWARPCVLRPAGKRKPRCSAVAPAIFRRASLF